MCCCCWYSWDGSYTKLKPNSHSTQDNVNTQKASHWLPSLLVFQNPESLDSSIQSTLSALFPPFEATASIVLSQLFRTIEERYHGDALQCLLDFLIPSKHLLESVQQAACVSINTFQCIQLHFLLEYVACAHIFWLSIRCTGTHSYCMSRFTALCYSVRISRKGSALWGSGQRVWATVRSSFENLNI